MTSITDLADQWLRLDQDPATRKEISDLLSDGDTSALENRLRGRIAFGTAGLRARMEAGFTRMNSLTVIQASQGLAAYLLSHSPDCQSKGVVIGRDARHNSDKFAKLTAAAFVAKGIKVWWFEQPVHTPLVPFAVSQLSAAAGVMITASHNPAQDNGYKVYWSNACQIIPPHDRGISAAIETNLEPLSWDESLTESGNNNVERILERMESAYYERISRLVNSETHFQLPSFMYTPLHGVGLVYMANNIRTMTNGGHTSLLTRSLTLDSLPFKAVAEQAYPDPTFPTVSFPNPEELGALELAISNADKESISLVIATDPDADRLAVAEKLDVGIWHQYTGNQLGILLASYVLEMYSSEQRPKLAMLCSTVSSGMLRAMASVEGFRFVETLTGFKWLGNVAQQLREREGYNVPFAFEEALGYMFTAVGHDKDGICAAAVLLVAIAKWKREGCHTLWQKLQLLYEKYGCFADANTYLTSPSPAVTNAVFTQIRALGSVGDVGASPPHPTHIGSKKILRWRDLTLGYDSGTRDNIPDLPSDIGSQMLTCAVEGGVRFTVRGSGTEPKIKLYIEAQADTMEDAQAKALAIQKLLIDEWFKPEEFGLSLA